MNVQHLEVRTPLGKGKIVYTFPDGTYACEYEFGGGQILLPGDPNVIFCNKGISMRTKERVKDGPLTLSLCG